MKTTSRRRSSSERRLLVIVLTGAVLVALVYSPLSFVGGVLELVSWPLRALGAAAPNSLGAYFSGMEELIKERDSLKDVLREREREIETLRSSIADYDALRAIRGSAPENALNAGVVLTPSQTPYDSLVIDRGEKDGVVKGSVVYAYEGRPIGVVAHVLSGSSVVALFSSPGIETSVYVRGADVHAKATGLGGGTLAVLVPHGASVSVGDEVLAPSIAPSVIGRVEWINDDPSAPGTIVSVSQADALTALRFVAVEREPRALPTLEEVRENLSHATTTVAGLFLPLSELASTTASSSVDTRATTTSSVGL